MEVSVSSVQEYKKQSLQIWQNITFAKFGRVWLNDASHKLLECLIVTISDNTLQTAKHTCYRELAISSIPSRREIHEPNAAEL